MFATDPLRLVIADVVREHPAVAGQSAGVVDDLVDRVHEAVAVAEEVGQIADEDAW